MKVDKRYQKLYAKVLFASSRAREARRLSIMRLNRSAQLVANPQTHSQHPLRFLSPKHADFFRKMRPLSAHHSQDWWRLGARRGSQVETYNKRKCTRITKEGRGAGKGDWWRFREDTGSQKPTNNKRKSTRVTEERVWVEREHEIIESRKKVDRKTRAQTFLRARGRHGACRSWRLNRSAQLVDNPQTHSQHPLRFAHTSAS